LQVGETRPSKLTAIIAPSASKLEIRFPKSFDKLLTLSDEGEETNCFCTDPIAANAMKGSIALVNNEGNSMMVALEKLFCVYQS
jgi:hypothetical protein